MKPGRPKKEPTSVISVPFDKIGIVETILKREIVINQEPTVRIRVPKSMIEKIKRKLK